MPSPKPDQQISALLKGVIAVADAKPINEIQLKGFERKVEKLMDAEPAMVHMILGMIQALRGDKAKAHKHHERACKLAPGDVICLKNWGASCGRLNDPSMAAEKFMKAEKLEPADLSAKVYLLESLASCGRYIEAAKRLKEYRKKGMFEQLQKLTGEKLLRDIEFVAGEMPARGLQDEDTVSFKEFIHKVIDASESNRHEVGADEDSIVFRFLSDGSTDEIDKMVTRLIDEWVETDPDTAHWYGPVSFTLTSSP